MVESKDESVDVISEEWVYATLVYVVFRPKRRYNASVLCIKRTRYETVKLYGGIVSKQVENSKWKRAVVGMARDSSRVEGEDCSYVVIQNYRTHN